MREIGRLQPMSLRAKFGEKWEGTNILFTMLPKGRRGLDRVSRRIGCGRVLPALERAEPSQIRKQYSLGWLCAQRKHQLKQPETSNETMVRSSRVRLSQAGIRVPRVCTKTTKITRVTHWMALRRLQGSRGVQAMLLPATADAYESTTPYLQSTSMDFWLNLLAR